MGFDMQKKKGMRSSGASGEPDYTSGKKSNPHATPSKKFNKHYEDHGKGKHCEEFEDYNEDCVQPGKVKKIW